MGQPSHGPPYRLPIARFRPSSQNAKPQKVQKDLLLSVTSDARRGAGCYRDPMGFVSYSAPARCKSHPQDWGKAASDPAPAL
jgi:hypothetical protein